MKNDFVDFYSKNNISPVSQDIRDLNSHLLRRENLYQMLAIDKRLFKDRDVIEIGAGSGYNSICFCEWGANLDILEPNKKGADDIEANLYAYKYNLYREFVENFSSDKKYDFVIAEGFLPSIKNQKQVLKALLNLVKKDGILVSTCIDEFSHFYEDLRRITGFILVENIASFSDKVSILCEAFSSHLSSLKFVSRPIIDWVSDVILNPANDNNFLSVKGFLEMIDLLEPKENTKLLAVNPCLVPNLSWYKNVNYSYKSEFINGFDANRHILLDSSWGGIMARNNDKNDILGELLIKFRSSIRLYKNGKFELAGIIKILSEIKETNSDLPSEFTECIREVIELLNRRFSAQDLAQCACFKTRWGRAQQYISIKRTNDF